MYHSRRQFLQTAAAALTLSGCGFLNRPEQIVISPSQKAWRSKDRLSKVAIMKCPSYDVDIFKLLVAQAPLLDLPSLKGKTVVLKPNIVDYRPGLPLTTDPAVIAAAAHFVNYLGASKIIVAEGPANIRDTEFLLEATGIGPMCKKLGLPFVDLNLDDLSGVDNADGFTALKQFYLPQTILKADCVISLPKLKTHHWARMTAAMKNFFGAVPGRKYGYPKNLLHFMGIGKSIIDLNHLIAPTFAIVDAVVAMEGEGPLSGTPKDSGFIICGKDLAAVDATCARTMRISPYQVNYLQMAAQVIGNINVDEIKQVGLPIDAVAQLFELPATFKGNGQTGNAATGGT